MKGFNPFSNRNKSIFTLLVAFLLVIIYSTLSFAGGDGMDPNKELIYKIVNFLVFAGVLTYLLKNVVRKFFKERSENIAKDLSAADTAMQAAEDEFKKSEADMSKVADEVRALTEKIRQEGEIEKQNIIAHAKEMAEKIKAQTEAAVQRELEAVRKKIKEETLKHTMDAAEEMLKKQFEEKDQEKVADMISGEISQVKDIDVFLKSPVSANLKKKVPVVIDSKKQVSQTTMDFIKILMAADDEKKKSLSDIQKAYETYLSDVTGTKKATIYSATDLSDATLGKITSSLKKVVGKDIEVEFVKDSSIIGGIITKIGSLVFDASVKTQLDNMRENLKKEVV